jgi:hypothetical protein
VATNISDEFAESVEMFSSGPEPLEQQWGSPTNQKSREVAMAELLSYSEPITVELTSPGQQITFERRGDDDVEDFDRRLIGLVPLRDRHVFRGALVYIFIGRGDRRPFGPYRGTVSENQDQDDETIEVIADDRGSLGWLGVHLRTFQCRPITPEELNVGLVPEGVRVFSLNIGYLLGHHMPDDMESENYLEREDE